MLKGYLLLSILCLGLLLLPFLENNDSSFVNHLFFSVSIVSTTGLVPADFAGTYNFAGQLVSLVFIQLGGIGYMALSSFIILKQFKRLPSLSARLLKLEFNLPQRYPFLQFVYSVFIFTAAIEIIGSILLYKGFQQEGIAQPTWNAIFHSISAFCTAGFSLHSDSLSGFSNNGLITNTIIGLSVLGSTGFIVLLDFWLRLVRKRKTITLTSKIILSYTLLFIIAGTVMIYFSDNTLLQDGWAGFKYALFQCIAAHTTVGFNNYDIASINQAGLFIIILLMIVGASPAGTGGGIKTTSVSAIFAVLASILQRRNRITFLGREIPASNIYLAVASALFYGIIFIIGSWAIVRLDGSRFEFEKILFETASALSTVGLSAGITADLSDSSKLVLALLMFIGRLGVLTFGLALIAESPLMRHIPKQEDIAI